MGALGRVVTGCWGRLQSQRNPPARAILRVESSEPSPSLHPIQLIMHKHTKNHLHNRVPNLAWVSPRRGLSTGGVELGTHQRIEAMEYLLAKAPRGEAIADAPPHRQPVAHDSVRVALSRPSVWEHPTSYHHDQRPTPPPSKPRHPGKVSQGVNRPRKGVDRRRNRSFLGCEGRRMTCLETGSEKEKRLSHAATAISRSPAIRRGSSQSEAQGQSAEGLALASAGWPATAATQRAGSCLRGDPVLQGVGPHSRAQAGAI